MKKFKMLFLFFIAVITHPVFSVPIDHDAIISDSIEKNLELLDALADTIEKSGYTCTSISGAHPFYIDTGFDVTCNNFSYSYEVENKGGRWMVTVK